MVGVCAEKLLFLFLWIFSFLCWTCFSQRQVVPAIYVLGDSLVDVGNNNYLSLSPLKANFPHNGVDFTDGKSTGRFSNGKNAADFIAEKVGLPTSPPYLSLNSSPNKSNAFLNGVSFASGGAGILDGSDQTLSMNKQIEYYSIVYADIVQQLGSVKAQTHLSKSLFGIVIGSNDLLGYFKPRSSRRSNTTPQLYIDMLLSTLKSQVKSICNLGARKLVFIGAGAVGCCPSQRLQNQTRECNQETNYWSLKYNEGVKRILEGMKSDFPDMNYSFFNTYSVLLDLIQNPANSGFTEVKGACCGLGDLRARIPCLPISRYCSNRKEHVFWDLYHPTERAAQIFANLIFDGPKKYVEPLSLRELVSL